MILRSLLVAAAAFILAQTAAATTKWTLTPTTVGGFDVRRHDLQDADRILGNSDLGECSTTNRRCEWIWYSGLTIAALLPPGLGYRTQILTVTLEERGCPAFLGCPALGRRWRAAQGLHIGSSLSELRKAYPRAQRTCRACFKETFTPISGKWLLAQEKHSSDRGRLVFEAMVRRDKVTAFRYSFVKP